MVKKKTKVHATRILWDICPVTKVVKNKKKYNRKLKHKG